MTRLSTHVAPRRSSRIEAFIAAYTGTGNATQAAARAGYSRATAKQQGSRLLKRPDVIDRLQNYRQGQAEKHAWEVQRIELESDRTRSVLAAIAYFDVRKLVRDDGSVKSLQELDEQTAMAVVSIEVSESTNSKGEKVVTSRVRLANRLVALDMAARMTGVYNASNRQHGNVREMTDDELRARIMVLVGSE
jgi:phage terminase small subunit